MCLSLSSLCFSLLAQWQQQRITINENHNHPPSINDSIGSFTYDGPTVLVRQQRTFVALISQQD